MEDKLKKFPAAVLATTLLCLIAFGVGYGMGCLKESGSFEPVADTSVKYEKGVLMIHAHAQDGGHHE